MSFHRLSSLFSVPPTLQSPPTARQRRLTARSPGSRHLCGGYAGGAAALNCVYRHAWPWQSRWKTDDTGGFSNEMPPSTVRSIVIHGRCRATEFRRRDRASPPGDTISCVATGSAHQPAIAWGGQEIRRARRLRFGAGRGEIVAAGFGGRTGDHRKHFRARDEIARASKRLALNLLDRRANFVWNAGRSILFVVEDDDDRRAIGRGCLLRFTVDEMFHGQAAAS